MKKLFKYYFTGCFCTLVLIDTASAQNAKNTNHIRGAFQMISQTFKGEHYDTTFTTRRQMKIYSESHVMYVRINPGDAVSAFGIGTYSADAGKLTENMIYSATDSVENTNSFSGTVNIDETNDGYMQVIPEIMSDKGKIRLTEQYRSLGSRPVSLIDGDWKEMSAYKINKKDTVTLSDKKYKIYYRGSFMSGNFQERLSHQKQTIIEFGKFVLTDQNSLKETAEASTLPELTDDLDEVEIVMHGNDKFTAIKTWKDGSKEVETYERLK